ncbi:MAG: RNA recognition motif domain-containing protein [Geitlerinemataceae cyanobacterium]
MSTRLYVGNLPKEIEQEELQELFKDSGVELSIKIVTDRKTGKCRGFAFVTVEADEDADKIIAEYDGKALGDTSIKVEKAQPRKKEDAPAPVRSNGGARRGNKPGSGLRSAGSTPAAASQPDPRWADELAKLKQQLEAQTTNS